MRPLVEATVADETGVMKATFFNQPWLEQRYPAGTRLALHGKFEGRRRFRVQAHARTGDAVSGAGAVAHYPATEGLSSTQILALVREHSGALADVVEPLPALVRARERLPDRSAALAEAHFGDGESAADTGRRRLAFDELLLVQLALLRRRLQRRSSQTAPVLGGERELTAQWLDTMLPFSLTGDQDARPGRRRRRPGPPAADAAPADGRGRLGQDRRGPVHAAPRRRARLPGRADGAHRDAGRTALRHGPGADARRGCADRAAHRVHAGAPARRSAGQAGHRGASTDRRHPRPDRRPGASSPAWPLRWSTSSTASGFASGPRWTPRLRRASGRTSCT